MKTTTVEDLLQRLKDIRHEMYSNDRTPDGDAVQWALSHVEERLKELSYVKGFQVSKETGAWLKYVPDELPPAMRVWACRYLSKEESKVMYGLNSIEAKYAFAAKVLQDLEILP